MALYTIGEVALLCDINPVTLRAWQRRYGLLKPQRTDGGHRLFNDADIDRIREIKRWINNGVQVSKVKMLLSNENIDVHNGWREQQETLLSYLQSNNLHSLRMWIKERGQDYPAQTLNTHLFIPLRRRLQCQQPILQALLGILDGVLIGAQDFRYLALAGLACLAGYAFLLWPVAIAGSGDAVGFVWLWGSYAVGYMGLRALTLGLRARSDVWLRP